MSSDLLASIPLFSGVDDSNRRALSESMTSVSLHSGETLVSEGDEGDAMFVLVSGRLRAFVSGDGEERAVGDVSAGEVVGEMALISDEPRSATVRAVRDSQLLRLDRDDFMAAVNQQPSLLVETARVVVRRLERSIHGHQDPSTPRTIAVIAAGGGSDPSSLARELAANLGAPVVDSAARDEVAEAGSDAVAAWLHELELTNERVVYLADPQLTPWTERCLRQADRVLLAAERTGSTDLNEVEQALPATTMARCDLILVHPASASMPSGTSAWLRGRQVTRHHHVRAGDGFGALTRNLTGDEVAVVLSGGGARGMCHIGVLRAFEEREMPIDLIGGTSFGSLLAGWHAVGNDWKQVRDLAHHYLVAKGKPIDLTIPVTALTSSKKVSDRIHESAGETDIEDMWRPMFAVSTNLTQGRTEVHSEGKLWKAIRASIAIPGVFAPVRSASGDVLVDGGIMDNLPIATMRQIQDGGPLIAVDLRREIDMPSSDLPDHGHVPGLGLLWRRLNPVSSKPKAPTITDVMLRTTEAGSVLQARAQLGLADHVLRPDVSEFALMDWQALDRLIEVGYEHAMAEMGDWA